MSPGRSEPSTILALETSCDDTCAAVLDAHRQRVLSNAISSQGVHDRYGGVVPEIAARHHLELVNLLVEQALTQAGVTLDDIGLIAATQGPGLVGALLVGFSTAKALAAGRELAFAPVDHLQGHVAANFIVPDPTGEHPDPGPDPAPEPGSARAQMTVERANQRPPRAKRAHGEPQAFEPPFVCLIASGGHTLLTHVSEHDGYRVLGQTLDDAAGEAFDKGARMLGLGYPGGAALERLARGATRTPIPSPARPPSARAAARGPAGRRSSRALTSPSPA